MSNSAFEPKFEIGQVVCVLHHKQPDEFRIVEIEPVGDGSDPTDYFHYTLAALHDGMGEWADEDDLCWPEDWERQDD